MDGSVTLLVALAMAVGIVGTLLPGVPGLTLVAGAALAYGLADGFGNVGAVAFAMIVAIGVAGTVAGVWLPKRAAGRAGASRQSMLLGVVGAVVGLFTIPVVGFPLGGVAGVYLGERMRTGDPLAARRATVATLKGFGLAAAVQLGAALVMAAIWVVWVIAS